VAERAESVRRKTLTATGVEKVRPPADNRRRRMDWDSVVPGLALRTTASSSKSWVLVTRLRGKAIFDTLGKYPGVPLTKARSLAREGLEMVARGEDPRLRRRIAKKNGGADPELFEAVAVEFVEKWAKPRNRTWEETERILEKYVTAKWKGRRLREIGRQDAVELVEAIAEDAPIQANRTLATIKKLFSWALDRGLIDVHPVARLSPPAPEKERDRVLADVELKKIWGAWDAMPYPWGPALKLVLLTATRRGEVEEMAWSEVDLKDRLWTIPAERVKTKLPLLVPLSAMAVEVLGGLPRFAGCEFVFTTRGNKAIRDWSGAVETATEISGVNSWRVHDLRRTARTNLSKLGVAADIAERVLGHVIPGVRKVYDRHEYVHEKRDALEQWAKRLRAILNENA
jgi:integrase